MNIKQYDKAMELRKPTGLTLVDLIAGVRASARQGWRPWCEDCARPARYIAARLVQGRCFLSVTCEGHTHREIVEPAEVHNATRILLLALAKRRKTILSASWNGFLLEEPSPVELSTLDADDVALHGEPMLTTLSTFEPPPIEPATIPRLTASPVRVRAGGRVPALRFDPTSQRFSVKRVG